MAYSDSDDGTPVKFQPKQSQQAAEGFNDNNDSNESATPTKRMYRTIAWKAVKRLYSEGTGMARYVNRRVPLFPQAELAAERLAETPEFKEAKNIKVNIDMAQEAVKLQVLKANKTLFVAPTQNSEYLYAKITTPENLDEIDLDQQRRIVKVLAGKNTYQELGIDQAEPLDMVVVGCVAVSERGQRIGKGNGYVDLEIAVLHSLGVITPKTVIATTVDNSQLFPEFPADLFHNYDFTVDLIITPTRVIRVEPRPEQRTIGVQWGLLSSRRLKVMRVLKPLKKRLEDQGQTIELKDEDTDVEKFTTRRTRRNGGGGQQKRRPKRNKFGTPKHDRGDDDAEPDVPRSSYNRDDDDGESAARGNGGGEQSQRRKRPFKGGRMRPINNKSGGGENAGNNSGRVRQQKPSSRPPRQLKPQLQNGVRICVSNMFSVPFKELKEELRNRDCYPAKINQSRNGRCFLIFPKREDAEEQVQVNELLQKLADMYISVPQKNSTEMKQIKLKCEVQSKPRSEFDPNDATSITSAANRAAMKATRACTKLANSTTSTDTDPNATTKPATHVNVDELAAEVNAATLLAARAAKAAEAIAQKVLQETKPAIEAENGKEDNQEQTAKLATQVETLTKAGAEALVAGTKAEAAAAVNATVATSAANATSDTNTTSDTTTNATTDTTATSDTTTNATTDTTATSDTTTNATTDTTATSDTTTNATTADAPVTEPASSKKEGITAMNNAIQEAARATAAVSFAIATLYELVPSASTQQQTVTVASVQTLTHLFGALLPKVA